MMQMISFDGLNRCGKGTQIKMLKEYLKTMDLPVEVLRGDGSRPGIDSPHFYDPKSRWWMDWQANKEKSGNDWNLAYQVLNEENCFRSAEFYRENTQGVILMDRSHISRYFMLRQQMVETSFERVAKNTKLHPETYFFLDVPKEVLLKRVSDEDPHKADFRREILQKWYDLWVNVVDNAQEFLNGRLKRIDGTQSPRVIHEYVKSYL